MSDWFGQVAAVVSVLAAVVGFVPAEAMALNGLSTVAFSVSTDWYFVSAA